MMKIGMQLTIKEGVIKCMFQGMLRKDWLIPILPRHMAHILKFLLRPLSLFLNKGFPDNHNHNLKLHLYPHLYLLPGFSFLCSTNHQGTI
jgi:hypothetical protein